MLGVTPPAAIFPTPEQIADLRLAASQMTRATRRAFQAEMTLKYCDGNPRRVEAVFGWGRQNVEVGLGEKQTGIVCLSLHAAFSGRSRWEDHYPQAAAARNYQMRLPCELLKQLVDWIVNELADDQWSVPQIKAFLAHINIVEFGQIAKVQLQANLPTL